MVNWSRAEYMISSVLKLILHNNSSQSEKCCTSDKAHLTNNPVLIFHGPIDIVVLNTSDVLSTLSRAFARIL